MTDKQKANIVCQLQKMISDLVAVYGELGIEAVGFSVDTHKEVKEIYDVEIVRRGVKNE
jgi:hypothetical protein